MTNQLANASYDETLRTLDHAKRGSYSDLSYSPAFRASGIFFAIVDEHTTTRVSFLNYWREKNNITSVGALLTFRDSEGQKLLRQYVPIDRYVYQFDVREFLQSNKTFVGSLELEIFSNEDLKFQFPALTVFYETAEGISFVHTNQRVFNNTEDNTKGSLFNPWQTGFDICFGPNHGPFVFLMNGPTRIDDASMQIKVLNASGETLERTYQVGEIPAYGARRVDFSGIDGVRDFLGNRTGFCKMNLNITDIYSRFACGNAAVNGSWLSVTHSYFDTTGHDDYFDATALDEKLYRCFIPFNLVDGLETELVFYPIMAPANLQLTLQCFDDTGRRSAQISVTPCFDSASTQMERINVRKLLHENGIMDNKGLYCLQIEAENDRLPARVTYGLNYSGKNPIGCNISSSAYMAKSYETGKRSYLWGPLMFRSGGRNIILVSHLKKLKEDRSTSDFKVSLFGDNGIVACENFRSPNGTCANMEAEELLKTANYRPRENEVLWYVLESSDPSYVCNQIHISADGFVGGDHSF